MRGILGPLRSIIQYCSNQSRTQHPARQVQKVLDNNPHVILGPVFQAGARSACC
jgi:hypothetical protein